jgi:hypothetical protein
MEFAESLHQRGGPVVGGVLVLAEYRDGERTADGGKYVSSFTSSDAMRKRSRVQADGLRALTARASQPLRG